jgi:hypothetical protein
MAENAALFLAYGELQSLVRQIGDIPITQALSLPQLTLAAAGAGSITSIVLCVWSLPTKGNFSVDLTMIYEQDANRTCKVQDAGTNARRHRPSFDIACSNGSGNGPIRRTRICPESTGTLRYPS